MSSLSKPMILIISFKILSDLRKSVDLFDSNTLVDDSLVNEKQKGNLDETSEDWEVADNGLQRIHSFSPLGQ